MAPAKQKKQILPLIPIREKVKTLNVSMKKFEKDLRGILFEVDPLDNGSIGTSRKRALKRIDKQRAFCFAWIAVNISAAYMEAADRTRAQLINLDLRAKGPNDKSKKSRKSAMVGISKRMNKALDDIEKRVKQYFSEIEKVKTKIPGIQNLSFGEKINIGLKDIVKWSLLKQEYISKTGAPYYGAPAKQEIVKRIKDLFIDVFGDFDFIEIPTSKGGVLHYRPDAYFNMLARTECRAAQTQATLDLCSQWGCRLVMVSTHDDPCPKCKELEGTIYSIDGKDPDFEKLPDQLVPVHPNCEHSLNPVTRLYLESIGRA